MQKCLKTSLFRPKGLLQLMWAGILYKTLCGLLGAGWVSKENSSGSAHPAGLLAFLAGLPSVSEALAPCGSDSCWHRVLPDGSVMLSHNYAVLPSTGQIIPLWNPVTRPETAVWERIWLHFCVRSDRKRDQEHGLCPTSGPRAQGSFVSVKCGKGTKKCIWPKPNAQWLYSAAVLNSLIWGMRKLACKLLEFKVHPWTKTEQECRYHSKMFLQWIKEFRF